MTAELETAASRSLANWAAEAEAAAGIARALATTAFLPDSLKIWTPQHRLDLDATVAQTTAALLTGQELGLSPMASLRSIDVIPPGSGSPALRAMALRGLLQHHGHDIWIKESTATRAVVQGRRAGDDFVHESVWTMDRAKRMQLRGFNDPKGAWQRMPTNQLVARATAEVARWIASDALLGLPYISEEIFDIPDGDGAVPIDGAVSSPSPPGAPRRKAPARRSSGGTRALPAGRTRASSDDASAGAPETAASDSPPAAPPISGKQRAALWAGMRSLGLTDRDEGLAALSNWVGRQVKSSNDLTDAEADAALDAIKDERTRRDARAAAEEAQLAAEAERAQTAAEGGQEGAESDG